VIAPADASEFSCGDGGHLSLGAQRSAGSKPTCGHATAFPSRCDAQWWRRWPFWRALVFLAVGDAIKKPAGKHAVQGVSPAMQCLAWQAPSRTTAAR
jgi:hypothetical protein